MSKNKILTMEAFLQGMLEAAQRVVRASYPSCTGMDGIVLTIVLAIVLAYSI